MQYSAIIGIFLYVVVATFLYLLNYWDPRRLDSAMSMSIIAYGFSTIAFAIYFRTLTTNITISDMPFRDDKDEANVEKLKIEMKLQEYKALGDTILDEVRFMLGTPDSHWSNVQQTKDGIKLCKYVSNEGWPHPQLLVRCTWFAKGANAKDVMRILSAKDVKTRNIYDENCAVLNVVCDFEDDHGIYIVNNWQKEYFGGLISSREFVTLAIAKTDYLDSSLIKQTVDADDTFSDANDGKKIEVLLGGSRFIDLPEFPETSKRPRAKILMGGSAVASVEGGCRITQYGSVIVGGWVPDSVTHSGLINTQIDVARSIKRHLISKKES